MKQFTPQQKHEILLEYTPYSRTHSFSALARRHNVVGGKSTVKKWFDRWNYTIASLKHKKVAGRPRILTPAEVKHNIQTPIMKANQAHKPIHYTNIKTEVERKTGKEISIQTIRRYGKEECGGKQINGRKRTADECK